MEQEIWKDIPGYENRYQVSNTGFVKSFLLDKAGRILKNNPNKKGYMYVDLCRDNQRKAFRVNRLVAINFLENPERKEFVNHVDGNKANNSVGNLEWSTRSENELHAFATGLKKKIFGVYRGTGQKRGRSRSSKELLPLKEEYYEHRKQLISKWEIILGKKLPCPVLGTFFKPKVKKR